MKRVLLLLVASLLLVSPVYSITHAENPKLAKVLRTLQDRVLPHRATCSFYFSLFGVSLENLLGDHRISIVSGEVLPDSIAETRLENNFASEITFHPSLFKYGEEDMLAHTVIHELGHLADFNAPYKTMLFSEEINLEGGEIAEIACLGKVKPGVLTNGPQ